MGTEVQLKSYLPGYFTMRDLNEDTSIWALFNDRTLNGQMYNGMTSMTINGYSEYYKELLRQTMLRHEEIFRKQVMELHRLYHVQRDLMVELRRKEEQFFSVQVQSTLPSLFSTQNLQGDIEKSRWRHCSPLTTTSCSMATISGVEDAQKNPNGISSRSGPISIETGIFKVNHLPNSKSTKFARKLIDLQLPADAYVEDDDAECSENKDIIRPFFGSTDCGNGNCGLQNENYVNLTLGTTLNGSSEAKKPCSPVRKRPYVHKLADLNEPLEEASCEEVAISYGGFPFQTAYCEWSEGHQKSTKSFSGFLGIQKDLCPNKNKAENGMASPCTHRREKGQERLSYNIEIGQSGDCVSSFISSLNKKDARLSSESFLLGPGRDLSISTVFSPKQNKTESFLREKSSLTSDPSDLSSDTVKTSPRTIGPQSALARKPPSGMGNAPIEVEAVPCAYGSSPMDATSKSSITSSKNLGIAWENRQHGHDFRSATTSGGKACLNASGAHHSFLSESSGSSHVSLASVSLEKPIFINDADPPYYRREGLVGQKRSGDLTHPNSKVVKSVDLNLAPPNGFQNRLDPPKESRIALGYSKIISSFCASNPRADQEKETEHSIGYPETFPSILKAEETGSLSSSSKRILGLPAPRWGEISFTSACHQEISSSADAMNRVKEEFIQVGFPRHITKLLDSDKRTHMEPAPEISVAEESNGFRRIINLNSASANMDRLMSPVRSSNDEMLFPPAASVKGTTTRFVFEIDLEAPVTLLSEEQIPSAESASHCSHLGWEATEIEDMHAKAAAEAIQIMSLDKSLPSDRISPASAEALLWLAHVISSNPDDLDKILDSLRDEGDGDPESSDIDGMDYFEYKTLELKETKVDERCFEPLERDDAEEEETGMAYLLLNKPRRGPARKRRQKRDFQRDILPGLASLSRHEVTEDLQLMRTSVQLWQPARNQSRCQAKGRMRPRAGGAAAATAVEMPVDPQPGTDVETGVKSILGWGRTTRRGRRQRCSLGNAVVLPQG